MFDRPQDGDQKQADKDEAENAKDSATEKDDQSAAVEATENGAAGDAPVVSPKADEKTPEVAENGTEAENVNETTATTLNESKEVVEGGEDANAASTPATDSAKKAKKEKSAKKRFLSFRSFSFSKKDKQKPAKKDAEEKAAVTNGECEKVPEEVGVPHARAKCYLFYHYYLGCHKHTWDCMHTGTHMWNKRRARATNNNIKSNWPIQLAL